MMLNSELTEKYCLHKKDTGSTMIQLIDLEEKTRQLIKHLNKNHKDVPAKRAMLKNLAKKKRLLIYLKKNNPTIYQQLSQELEQR